MPRVGVPKETRQALVGGFTTFERILPGPDRMYPDTDSPPTRITQERVAEARSRLRPPPWERIERYMSWRVPEETAHYLIRRGGAEIVDAVVEKTGVDGLLAGIVIGQQVKALKRRGIPVERLGIAEWIQVFDLFTDGRIPREAIPAVATRMAQDSLDAQSVVRHAGHRPAAARGLGQGSGSVDVRQGYRGEQGGHDGEARALPRGAGRARCSRARPPPRKWRRSSKRSSRRWLR